jgi:polysaccharide biosynthesis transport protein
MNTEQNKRGPKRGIRALRRRAAWILLCVVLSAGAVYGFSKNQPKKYTATAGLVFNNQQVAGLPSIVDVSATASTPVRAAALANAKASQFVAEQQNSNHAYYASVLRQVNKRLAGLSAPQRAGVAGLALQERAQSLTILAELRDSNVQIAHAATVPTSPSSPKIVRNTILGAVVGLLLGLGLAFLLERLDRRIREPNDLETIYGVRLLGVVPKSDVLSRSARAKGSVNEALPHAEAEAFNLLHAHLRLLTVDRELRTLLVVSAAPGDGKTTVARHLATAAERMGSRVLLLEADMRHPTVAQQLDLPAGPGLSDVLSGTESLWSATWMVDLDSASANGAGAQMRFGGPMLDVLVAGDELPLNPGELMDNHAMDTVLEQAKSNYDFVVIDTPPLAAVSDAFPLLRKVDGVIIVGRVGRTRRDVAQRLHATLSGAGVPLLGVVANGVRVGRHDPYSYSKDYADLEAERFPTPTGFAAEPWYEDAPEPTTEP